MRGAGLALGLIAGAAAVSGRAGADDLIAAAQAQDLSPGGSGKSLSVDWVHPFSADAKLDAGAQAYELGDSRWLWGKLAASLRAGETTALYGELQLGPGEEGPRRFTYQLYKANLTQALRRGKVYAEVEDQYVDISATHGNIVKLGLTSYPSKSFLTALAYYASTSGNVGARYLTARAEWTLRRVTLLGGVSLGRTRPELFGVLDIGETRRSHEAFGGVRILSGAREMTVVVDALGLEGLRRLSLTLSWKTPL